MPKETGNPFPFDPVRDLPSGALPDVFRYIETRQEVQEACELLRGRLALTSETRIAVSYHSRPLIRALWFAMNRIGGSKLPPWPKSLNKDKYAALFRKARSSLKPEQFYFQARRRVLNAIALVERWCEDAATAVRLLADAKSATDDLPPPDPFADPRRLAKDMGPASRKIVEAACDRGGSIPIVELAGIIGWGDGDPSHAFQARKTYINSKLKKISWQLNRQSGEARLTPIR
jgi:hypothetical protein